jgi:CHAT domain-containing protein/tetratricopeptide (TPR) repeat protein
MPRPVAPRAGPGRWAVLTLLSAAALACVAAADPRDPQAPPPQPAAATPSPSPKKLSEADSKRLNDLGKSIAALWQAGKFAEAVGPARQAAAIFEKALGPDHWRTADARRKVETLETVAGLPEEGRKALAAYRVVYQEFLDAYEKASYPDAERLGRQLLEVRRRFLGEGHPDTAESYLTLAAVLFAQGKLAEAEAMYRKALAIELKALGEGHPNTALGYSHLAGVLRAQGKLAEAEKILHKVLAIRLETLGEGHPLTAESYLNLATSHFDQGKLAEAEAMYRKALAIWLNAMGEARPYSQTAAYYDNLAVALYAQGKLAEAEALDRKALSIRLKALGEGHPETAGSYNNLALALRAQGKLAEAEAMYRKALAIRLKALGEGHPDTAASYNNLATALHGQGKLPEAEAIYRKALAIWLKALGEGHPRTADSYNNLALVLHDRGKPAEAEALYRKALAIKLKAMGEGHPDTALSYGNLANALGDQGKLAEAEVMHRKALEGRREALGEAHPHTAFSYSALGHLLDRLGRADEALGALTAAVGVFERARLRGAKGLEAAIGRNNDPAPALAVALAHAGRGREAWGRWERGLARAVLDETAGRAARPLNPDERAREADLLGRSQAVDERISRLAGRPRLTADDEKRLDDLRREASELRRHLLEFQQGLEQKYGPLAGKPAALEEAQVNLNDDDALVGWVGTGHRHAACVVRRAGDPAWVMIPGTGPDGEWTKDDSASARRLRDALAARAPEGELRPLAEQVARQRLGPIEPHLKGVRRVVVVNSPALAGVPVEVLFAARSEWAGPGPVVAYAPSASMFTYLTSAKPPPGRPVTLLALGDPAYPAPKSDADKAPPPPEHGLFVAKVEPNGMADLFGIKAGDVLLEYNGTPLRARDDLHEVSADAAPKKIPLRRWRAGEIRTIEVAAGTLGLQFDPRPAPPVVLAQRAANEVLQVRGESQLRLPGTRREVAAIAGLFPSDKVTTLLGEQASESVVQELARSGKLKSFRYLHFAAHGRNDPRSAYRTALLLAPDPDRSADPAALDTDGEITAEQIARTWDLDADLVVLSACETALGKQAGGEGFLGFAQPLLAKGARGLVLSLWRVDDRATSLLMARFFENLLGKRSDLSKPMPKAEALAEAKHWLRSLTEAEVGPALEALDRGSVRPLVTAEGSKPATPSRPSGPRPFAHPYYWAAFILIGGCD